MSGARAETEHPILFTAPMVRAILAGEKVQTRRVAKPQPIGCGVKVVAEELTTLLNRCPYGKPGHTLWVKETFQIESNEGIESATEYPPPFKDDRPTWRYKDAEGNACWEQCHYAATDPKPELVLDDDLLGWRPSIFMPRWASRIQLEVTQVRLERVQAISHADVLAEGVRWEGDPGGRTNRQVGLATYEELWNKINSKRGYGWAMNPWVFVIEFKVIAGLAPSVTTSP